MTDTEHPLRLGILLSGSGRTLQNIYNCIERRRIRAQIACVISSRSDVYGVQRSQSIDLPTHVVSRRSTPDPDFHHAIEQILVASDVELVCMAGFCTLWHIPERFSHRVLNIHPALLPDFGGRGYYGLHVHKAVIDAGRSESGCTVHLCDNQYDHGPIILQRRVRVHADDTPQTLAERVFEQECIAYPQAIQWFAERRIKVTDGRVVIR